jgi:Fe-S-cluster containining protein
MSNRPSLTLTIAGADARVLDDSEFVQLSCGVNGCTSNCCTKSAPIILNPFEIALICRESSLSYEDLLDIVETDRANGFPLVMLLRDPACHFWTGKGCRIYAARPLACRLYPLGRVYDQGQSHIVLPELNVCSGLAPDPSKTVRAYLREQDTALQIEMADHWIEFVNEMEKLLLPDKAVTSVAFHMLVYSPDTPPAPGVIDASAGVEATFLLRLASARRQLPRFLKLASPEA